MGIKEEAMSKEGSEQSDNKQGILKNNNDKLTVQRNIM